ncbi:unnamed protein product [Rotaria socialis]|uniref:Anaphase-promoting complex subunit 4-like WD40 domain-containing protein n=1 Tax=Rotaria socialis TaxID=392032 RepID=A0A820KM80_9BILA|nr:unnamed protein product [Rotaria socialis]CAF3439489.1 unnamed protein product [Rotaria socialis]CAF3611669.1 unnamed protein product [Rotaria socialis]CAF4261494.1 unnamed protein product [Rotaria socialis]CAF4344949.1 unnamed protein product [Rotaria socialis]
MSGELLFELIEKAQWSFERKSRSLEENKLWSLTSTFKKWFGSSIKTSPNAERFLKQIGEKSTPISLHIPSNRLSLVINNTICIMSLITSDVLLEIPLDLPRTDEFNYLNCLTWSNNGKFLAYGHWSGIVCVYSSYDGQLLHELPTKTLNRNEDSFVEIWFSGSDASQFIDLLCLKRSGELIRYVMSRDDIASCAENKFDFNINCAIIDSNKNQIYIVPFDTKSILVWKIVDTNPSVIQIKQIIEETHNEIYIYGLVLSPDESCLVSILSDQSIVLHQNDEQFHCLSKVKINESRSFICDFNYWDNKTLILFYSNGSMSFHEGKETLEEYRYASNQLNIWPRFCRRTSNDLFLIDFQITKINDDENEEENSNIIFRVFRALKGSNELINEKLILIEHSDPCRLIENLVSNGEFGEALRICKVFNRTDLSDQIHEKALTLSSSQLGAHLTRIQSRLHVLQLCTTILYSTFNEQYDLIKFGLNQATRKQLFNNLYYSDQSFFQTIYDENLYLKDVQPKEIPLNISQKQILLYRRKLLDEKRKLFLYDDLINKYKIFQSYQSNIFEKFRLWDYKQIALRCAREGHLNGIRLVIERAIPSISPINVLTILDEISETVPLSEYEDLIPKYCFIEEKQIDRTEDDWTDEFICSYEENKQEDNRTLFIDWFNKRIFSFESFGFIENALQLCKYAIEIENLKELSSLYNNLYLEFLLNKISDQDLTLIQIKEFNEETIIDLILTFKYNSNQEDIDKRIQQVLIPSIDLMQQSNEYLKKVLIKKLQNDFDIYPIINSIQLKSIFKQDYFHQLITELILNINSINQISICQQLLTLINDKQDFEHIIESCRIFIKWSIPMIPSEMIRILESEESLSNAIVFLIQSAIKEEMNKMNISIGNQLYHDLERICRHRLSSQTLSNLFVSSLLKSGSIECFQIVRSMLLRFHIPLIIHAATDYIDSAKNGQDKSILLAKHCLDLIDDPSLVVNERNLIESQIICDFFHYSITPLEIRRHPNPIQIISAILTSNPQAYKNTSKLISLSLNLEIGNKQDKKDRCILCIAEHCLKINDLNMCWELCSSLIEENYGPSWKCCWELINKNPSYMNESILSFIGLHCDEILLDDVLKKSISIRDQSIPIEEYKVTSTYSYYINSFYDRDYSQQMDLKEIPLLKSPPIDEKSAIKYVNIDTPLFIMIYLSSNTNNDILIVKDNEYALQLSIYCQSLMKTTIPRNINAIPSMIINKALVENNENYTRLVENRQYSILNQLDNSIDLSRFQNDSEYRHLTVIGLFMCDNPSFEYGEQLAVKYNISIDECHHSYFEYLLTNSNLSINEIRKKIKPFLNSERLKRNRQNKLELVKRLHTNVFPLIDGKDYERLKLFYDIKKSLGDLTHAQKHIQAIQQLINILNNDFDYKLFLSSPELFVEKYANDSNIINLGLILDQIKVSSSLTVSSSWIYSYYLKYNPSSSLIFDLLNRIISFEDFYSFANHFLSSKNSLSISARMKIIQSIIEIIRSKEDQQRKTLEDILEKRLLNLEVLSKLSSNYSQAELIQLDQSENIEEQLQDILSNLLFKYGQFYLIIYLINNIYPHVSIYKILQSAIEKFNQQIKSGNDDDDLLLNNLLESISIDDINKKDLFSCLQQMCRSETVDRHIRYKLIDKLDKMFDKQGLQSDDLLLFEQYRLSTLLSSFHSFIELVKEDILTDENRCQLFQKYLLQAERLIHFESLIQILNNIWSKEQINNMKGIHGLSLKNELIVSMIEKNSDWERILTENIVQCNEEETSSLIEYLYNSKDLASYAYKIWLINPISSLANLLFQSSSKLLIDKEFLLMSIEKHRINDLLSINASLFDYYLNENLSHEDKSKVLNQIENNEEFLLKSAQLFIHKEDYSSFISFGLIIDTLEKYFLNK